jgi:hypothetical protein
MTTAKFLRRQAASCATLAKQTNDEESRQRCLRLEQTFLQLAETEEQLVLRSAVTPNSATKSHRPEMCCRFRSWELGLATRAKPRFSVWFRDS